MKNLILFLGFLFLATSCEKEIKEISITSEKGEKGDKGDPGHNGYSVVTKIDTLYNVTKDTIIGYETGYYSDIDTNGYYSNGDKFQNSVVSLNLKGDKGDTGATGSSGNDGSSMTIKKYILPPSPECLNGTVVFKTYSDNIMVGDSLYFCIAENGDTYRPQFTTTLVALTEFCRIRTTYIDGVFFYTDTLRDGRPGGPVQVINYRPIQYFQNFNIASSSYLHNAEHWNVLLTQASSNHIDAPKIPTNGQIDVYNGTLVMDNMDALDTVWCPEFIEPAALSYLKLDVGAGKKGYGIIFYVKYQNNQTEVLDSVIINSVPNFVWFDNSTYTQDYVYQILSNNISRWDVVRWGLRFVNLDGSSIPTDRNLVPNIDNVLYETLQIVQ